MAIGTAEAHQRFLQPVVNDVRVRVVRVRFVVGDGEVVVDVLEEAGPVADELLMPPDARQT
jgi:hypothetical protein